MKKHIFKCVLALGIFAGNLMPIMADETDCSFDEKVCESVSEDGVSTYGRVCQCGNGTFTQIGKYTTVDSTLGDFACIHHVHGYDTKYRMLTVTTYKCSNCGYTYSTKTYSTKLECHGTDVG